MASFEITSKGRTASTPGEVKISAILTDQILPELLSSVEGVMAEVGEEILGRAKEYVPVDEGTLQDSGETETTLNDAAVETLVGFGSGPSAAYAAYIHETPDNQFSPGTQIDRAAAGRGWKFLQRAAEEIGSDLSERLAEGIRARQGNGDA